MNVTAVDRDDAEFKIVPADTEKYCEFGTESLNANELFEVGNDTSNRAVERWDEVGHIDAAKSNVCGPTSISVSIAEEIFANQIETLNCNPESMEETVELGTVVNFSKPSQGSTVEEKRDYDDVVESQDQAAFHSIEKPEISQAVIDDDLCCDPFPESAAPPEGAITRPSLFDDGDDKVCIRSAVRTFYNKYNPEKLNTIDNILKQYLGFEIQLVLHLVQKYNAVDKSDLDIFVGSLNEKDLQEIAAHQVQLRKQISLANPVDTDEAACDREKDDNKEDNGTLSKKPQSLESLKGVINGHIGTAKQSLISSNIQDISSNFAGRFLTSWNTATSGTAPLASSNKIHNPSAPSSSSLLPNKKDESSNIHMNTPTSSVSVADELLLVTRLNSLLAEVQTLEVGKTHLNGNIRILKSQVMCAS